MRHEHTHRQEQLAVANHDRLADTVIKNGRVIDIYNHDIIEADVAIHNGYFVGIGTFEGKETISRSYVYGCHVFYTLGLN